MRLLESWDSYCITDLSKKKSEAVCLSDPDELQNSRIRDLEKRVNQVENDLSSILAELNAIKNLAKGLLTAVALVIGIDVAPLMGV